MTTIMRTITQYSDNWKKRLHNIYKIQFTHIYIQYAHVYSYWLGSMGVAFSCVINFGQRRHVATVTTGCPRIGAHALLLPRGVCPLPDGGLLELMLPISLFKTHLFYINFVRFLANCHHGGFNFTTQAARVRLSIVWATEMSIVGSSTKRVVSILEECMSLVYTVQNAVGHIWQRPWRLTP